MFAPISANWRAKPLRSFNDATQYIRATTTKTGLTIDAALDTTIYEKGVKVTKKQIKALNMTRHTFHGELNCALKPRHNESVTWPFSEATCQIIGCVYFRRRSRRMWSDVWSLARPWRRFRRNWGLPGSYCMNGVGRGVAMAQPV